MKEYTFNVSLEILNHLGRNLYRSFITILGEAISNAWDADAKNVMITIDRENNSLIVRDDGYGMTSDDFQEKFLKIGYSKRKGNVTRTLRGRPFIGRKGIGKLALLSCARTVTIISKTKNTEWVGGTIDNSTLDEAIEEDLSVNNYKLSALTDSVLRQYVAQEDSYGTILVLNGIDRGIKNKVEYLRKLVALNFRFSLVDPEFAIFINDKLVSPRDLDVLARNTQFVWTLNDFSDPFLSLCEELNESIKVSHKDEKRISVRGFLATVEKPSMLAITGANEKVSVDLYVNGRLREKDILKHIPTNRVVENYLYGQIHYDELDDKIDRFTSSREGIKPDDEKFNSLLNVLSSVLKDIFSDWDLWRTELRQDGDPDNSRMTKKERKSQELLNAISDEYLPPKGDQSRSIVSDWIDELKDDAEFNLVSYGDCFLSENLLRRYVKECSLPMASVVQEKITKWRSNARKAEDAANISFQIRSSDDGILYCDMESLTSIIEKERGDTSKPSLSRDVKRYKPIRDAVAHTSLLSTSAKRELSSICENIRARIVNLLSATKNREE